MMHGSPDGSASALGGFGRAACGLGDVGPDCRAGGDERGGSGEGGVECGAGDERQGAGAVEPVRGAEGGAAELGPGQGGGGGVGQVRTGRGVEAADEGLDDDRPDEDADDGGRLAARESVSVEDLGDEEVRQKAPTVPAALFDAIVPPVTPSGRPIRRTYPWTDDEDVLMAVARGRIVHPGMAGLPLTTRPDFVQVPVRDLPPIPVGLIWRAAHENARIRALAAAARAICPPPARRDRRPRPQPAA
jgi:hypothetical protein